MGSDDWRGFPANNHTDPDVPRPEWPMNGTAPPPAVPMHTPAHGTPVVVPPSGFRLDPKLLGGFLGLLALVGGWIWSASALNSEVDALRRDLDLVQKMQAGDHELLLTIKGDIKYLLRLEKDPP